MSDRELSQKQLEANRANSQKSTGPRSDDGKRKSSRNAVKHGFFARDLVLPGEDPDELSELKLGLLKRLNPRDALELTMVDAMVADLWKLRRVRKAERDLFIKADEAARAPGQATPTDAGILLAGMLCNDQSEQNLDRLHRYEKRLENSVFRAMRELRRLRMEETIDSPCNSANGAIEQHERENQTEQSEADHRESENEANSTVAPAAKESPESHAKPQIDENEPSVDEPGAEDRSKPRNDRSAESAAAPPEVAIAPN
jgi:hypothetical protein